MQAKMKISFFIIKTHIFNSKLINKQEKKKKISFLILNNNNSFNIYIIH